MPKHLHQLAVAVVCLTLAVGIAQAQRPGQTFNSPLKNFTIEVPYFPLGTKVQKEHTKDSGLVVFRGNAGNLHRIDYFRIPADKPVPADSTEQHVYYHRLLDALLGVDPHTVLAERDETLDGIMMLHSVVAYPAGSHIEDVSRGIRVDSVRGQLFFARGGFVYILQDEVGAPVFNKAGETPTTEELVRRADASLPELYRSIAFQ